MGLVTAAYGMASYCGLSALRTIEMQKVHLKKLKGEGVEAMELMLVWRWT